MNKKLNKKEKKIIASIITTIVLIILAFLNIKFPINNEVEKQTANRSENYSTNFQNQENTNNLIIDFIDVGQADSILIRNEEEAMLIDAGNNEDGKDVVRFIKDKKIKKLNYVIGTHPHEDHIGGLDDVIKSDLEIGEIMMPKIGANTKTFEDVLDAIESKSLSIISPKKGDRFSLGKAECEIMTDSILDKDNLNLSSIIIQLEFKNQRFLFMADAEKENEQSRNWEKVDLLKVGHHGSNTSTTKKFLKQTNPKYAVIMVGKDNKYGLPKDKVINRIKENGTKIYRTDKCGTIEAISDGTILEVHQNT